MDARKAIEALDKTLSKRGLSYTLYTCGGAQLIFLGYNSRRTQDVDLIVDEIDEALKLAALEVAKKLDLESDWLNNKVFPLAERLGKGWRRKAVKLFEGAAVTLMGLNRQHLINAKLHAAIDRRGEDYSDLIYLKPTMPELREAENYVLAQKGDVATAEVFVRAWVKELKSDLGLD